MTWPRAVALAAVVCAAVSITVGVAGLLVDARAIEVAWFALALVSAVPGVALGLVVSRHERANAVGPLLSIAGVSIAAIAASDVFLAAAAQRPERLPIIDALVSLTQERWMILFLPWAWLLLVFPDGRLRGLFARAVAIALPVVVVLTNLCASLAPGDYAKPLPHVRHVIGTAPVGGLLDFLALAFLGLLAACVIVLVRRYRTGSVLVRTQVRWLALAGLTVPGTLLACWVCAVAFHRMELAVIGLVAMAVAIPAATAIAILRTDLYDVDRALVSGAAYGLLAALVVGVVAAVSAVAGLVAGQGSTIIAVAATAITLLALNPMRRRLEHLLSRRLYPARERALQAVSALERRVSAGQAKPEDLEDVLRVALRDPGLRLGYRSPGADDLVDGDGRLIEPNDHALAIQIAGQQVGVLVPGSNSWRPPPREVATAVTMLVEMVRLRMELASALVDVEASRTRLLRAGYDERRRLERDLHDGAQQRLVALGMSLRLAQRHLPSGTVDVDGVIDEAVAEIGTAVAELRKIAHGLRPSNLDDGLPAALANLTSKSPMPIDLDLDAGELPDAVCTTAYFVASEAVTNAVKYASANRISLRVARVSGSVLVEVSDDGEGGAALRPGGGLAGLVDRVHALGGALRVVSPKGGGTMVEAVLPCES